MLASSFKILEQDTTFVRMPDGTVLRCFHRPQPADAPKGTVLVVTGRRQCLETIAETLGDWHGRGYDVISFDWRGQGLSDRPLPDRHKSHVASFDLYRRDLGFLHQTFVRPRLRSPFWLCAHSMGGLVALDWMMTDAPDAAGVVLIAPMLAMPIPGELYRVAHALSRLFVRLGLGDHYAWGERPFRFEECRFKGNTLTGDPDRYRIIEESFRANPMLAVGGVTWQWLDAALTCLLRVRANLRTLKIPVALLGGADDRVVRSRALAYAADRLPRVRYRLYPHARHNIVAETESIRAAIWKDIDAFLAEESHV